VRARARGKHTLHLVHVQVELLFLLEHFFPAALDELVEAHGETGHARAQIFEAEVDVWEGVGHAGGLVRRSQCAEIERGFECRRHVDWYLISRPRCELRVAAT
jgi:hypothetical protein